MTTKFTITAEAILHTDIKLLVQNNYTKYPNHRRRYEFYCSYDLFWGNQDYINKSIKDIVDAFGMRYLVVPRIGENLEKQIVIIFDTSESLFDDTCDLVYGKFLKTESDLEEINKHLDANNSALQSHCENQKKEINLLLKQKKKLKKELEACKNHQVDTPAYRDDIIGQISREKNELENANKAQTRYIKEMEENMKKGNEQYNELKHDYGILKGKYDRLEEAFKKLSADHDYGILKGKYDRLNDNYNALEEKRNKLSRNYEILEEKYEKSYARTTKYHSIHEFEQLKKANNYYRDKVHELFDILLTVEFRQKEEEKEKKEEKKDD